MERSRTFFITNTLPTMRHHIIAALFIAFGICACGNQSSDKKGTTGKAEISNDGFPEMEIVETDNLKVYYPQYSRIDHICDTMPSTENTDVIFVAEAAFTAELLDSFKHTNIIGPHVSSGHYYKGCGHGYSTWFTYANGKAEFHSGLSKEARTNLLKKTEEASGMAFTQYMIVYNGKLTDCKPFRDNAVNEYRCLCEDSNGRICIADSKPIEFQRFREALNTYGMKHAIYLDMGAGWNYSWYRDKKGKVHFIHSQRTKYTTNWVTFYK